MFFKKATRLCDALFLLVPTDHPFIATCPKALSFRRSSLVVIHRDFENSVGVYRLGISAVWAFCFVTIFNDS